MTQLSNDKILTYKYQKAWCDLLQAYKSINDLTPYEKEYMLREICFLISTT